MENYKIPDSSITASSAFDQSVKASNGRLHRGAAWAASVSNTHQWFQVNFGNLTTVSVIATQGRQSNGHQWITKYRVSYSHDGLLYAAYKENAATNAKVFWLTSPSQIFCNTIQLNENVLALYANCQNEMIMMTTPTTTTTMKYYENIIECVKILTI